MSELVPDFPSEGLSSLTAGGRHVINVLFSFCQVLNCLRRSSIFKEFHLFIESMVIYSHK